MPFHPVLIECEYCNFVGYTRVKRKYNSHCAASVALIILFSILFVLLFPFSLFFFCCIPGFSGSDYRTVHYCKKCKRRLGTAARTAVVVYE